MAQKHFVQLKLGSKSFEPTKISTEGCSDMDDFKESIKVKFSRKLKAYDSYELVLFEADGTTKISAMDSIDQLNENKMPLVAVVEPVEVQVEPTQKPAISITRHQDYKHSKAVHSSRSYLRTIAVELEKLYALEKAKPNEPPTFGDILWNSWRTPQPAPKLPNLPELGRYFTNQEWSFLEDLNNTVNPALHSELDVGIDGKTREVVLPIQLSHLAATCQRIGKKAKVVNEVSDLIVKNEGSVSGGSPNADKKL
jgi:hypothetical protein